MDKELEREWQKLESICRLFDKFQGPMYEPRKPRLIRESPGTDWYVYGVVNDPVAGSDDVTAVKNATRSLLSKVRECISYVEKDLASLRDVQSEMLRIAES